MSTKNYYRDVRLPLHVARILVEDYGYTPNEAERLVAQHKRYIKLAFNAYPIADDGNVRLIAATVTTLRGGKHHGALGKKTPS